MKNQFSINQNLLNAMQICRIQLAVVLSDWAYITLHSVIKFQKIFFFFVVFFLFKYHTIITAYLAVTITWPERTFIPHVKDR